MASLILTSKSSIEDLQKNGGGKATNLARLAQTGVNVPPWFCISSNAFSEFIEQFKNVDLWSHTHAEVEALFLTGPIHSDLIKEIENLLKSDFPNETTFAVRSSGIGEDSEDHSFAGQFSSYLHQTNLDQVLKSLKMCWASSFTERARSYRSERKISVQKFSMGVVIQKMVFADVAGRVAKAICELGERFGTKKDDGLHVNHELTQEELAQLVGASRETVNKALADFASRGWVKLEPRAVIVLDYERLVKRGR